MKRRTFIKGSAAAVTLPFWLQGCSPLSTSKFPIHLNSDHGAGHSLMEARKWERASKELTETIIVGGGIAGIAAAASLDSSDFKLFELSHRLGGTSGAQAHEGLTFSQGAHYELAYPEYYGEEVLQLFESLKIIKYEPWKKNWSFVDGNHIIPFARRQQCYENGKMRKEVIADELVRREFYVLIDEFQGKMPLPTRLIDEDYRYLNEVTFFDYLTDRMLVNKDFERQLDYHMLDDWGGTSRQVSALAGIHYFMCRPYLTQAVDLFSPTKGNYYFLNKMAAKVQSTNLMTGHLVSKVEKAGSGFEVKVLDLSSQTIRPYQTDNIIYAGQKHALKYVYPKEAELFDQEQAPWMVLNFVCEGTTGEYGFWQNEFLGENMSFLGFIDSSVQDRSIQKGKRVITAYYCLKPEDREYLTTVPDHKEEIAQETIDYVEEMLGKSLKVEACYINVMGHAMSIPTPGFLFNDANDKDTDLVYAGVDNGRLPLLYEAVDSGIMAAQKVN